ncbi:MAG: glycosyltransferase family 39 protein [Actinobacteria bacterium]|nr:glycosyltransferase family 39 protein [Actinomycetota bacterium]
MRKLKLDTAGTVLIIALLLGLALRAGAWQQNTGADVLKKSPDSVMYSTIANNLIAGKGYVGNDHMIARSGQPTAFYGPVYPFYLAMIYAVFGQSQQIVLASHILLALITIILVYLLGKKLYGRTEGAIAALIFAVLPQIIYYNFLLITETLYIFLEVLFFILVVALLQKKRPWILALAIIGVLFGILYLCRQGILIFPVIFLPVLWLRYRDNGYTWLLQSTFVFMVAALLVITPWAVRNYLTFGEPLMGTTTGPATLWWGTLEDKGIPLTVLLENYRNQHADKSELQMSRMMTQEVKENLSRKSAREVIAMLGKRMPRLFGFPKHISLYGAQTRFAMMYTLLAVLGTAGLFISSSGRYERLLLGIFIIATMSFHIATLAVFRYLMPLMPFFAIGLINLFTYLGTYVKHARQAHNDCLTVS